MSLTRTLLTSAAWLAAGGLFMASMPLAACCWCGAATLLAVTAPDDDE
jgi:hypothetical protein